MTMNTSRLVLSCGCNQNCLFCDARRAPSDDRAGLLAAGFAADGLPGRVNITGGEPTLDPRLPALIRKIKTNKRKYAAVLTNGLKLASEKYLETLEAAGLDEVILSFFEPEAGRYDALTGAPGALVKKLAALENLRRSRIKTTVNLLLYSGNQASAAAIVRELHEKYGIKDFALSVLEPDCDRVKARPWLVPEIGPALASLGEIAAYCGARGLSCVVPANGAIPPCAARKLGVLYPAGAVSGADVQEKNRLKPAALCAGCADSGACAGLIKAYAVGLAGFLGGSACRRSPRANAAETLHFLARKIRPGAPAKLQELLRLLFGGKEPAAAAGHFKFDVSFPLSADKYSRLRFTYNDLGEKKRLRAAVRRIFSLFGSGFDPAAVKKALALSGLPLTFGLDWAAGRKRPALKLYFETAGAQRGLVKALCGLTGLDFAAAEPYLAKNRLCAAGVTFTAEGALQLKLYFYCGKKYSFTWLTARQLKAAAAFQARLRGEPDAFYLHCVTFAGKTGGRRDKLYKIYATKEYRPGARPGGLFAERDLELASLAAAAGAGSYYQELRADLGAAAGRGGAQAYPIAVSLALEPGQTGGRRFGVYFSLLEAAHV